MAGIANYETLVTNDDDVPNKKYVDDTVSGKDEFAELTDVTAPYNNAGALTAVNGATDGMAETTILVEAGTNAFKIEQGTTLLDVQADLDVTSACIIDQDLQQSADPSFNTVTSTQATGTAPFTVSSTTVVTNLNADQVDGRDETEFALLAGRSGGQDLIGGTDASDNLTLESTSNGTKGNVVSKDNFVIGTGAAGVDYTLTFDGETNDGEVKWMEDESEFRLGNGM